MFGAIKRHPLVAVFVAVMLAEGIGLWAVLPPPRSGGAVASEADPDAGPIERPGDLAEVLIDDFSVVNTRNPSCAFRIEGQAVVLAAKDSRTLIERRLERHNKRVREALVVAIREATPTDLDDPSLDRIRDGLAESLARALQVDREEIRGVLLPGFAMFAVT